MRRLLAGHCRQAHPPSLHITTLACAGKKGKLPWWGASGWATITKPSTGSTGTLSSVMAKDAAKQAERDAANGAAGGGGGAAGTQAGGQAAGAGGAAATN